MLELLDTKHDDLNAMITKHHPDIKPYESIYRDLHRSPELSGQEKETSTLAASHLRKHNYEVHENIGGYGVAGVLRNGEGPTVLIRADMDALPVLEKTGLPYASCKVVKGKDGVKVPVMHGCGHDTHVAAMLGAIELLSSARNEWKGTLVVVFQPSEEELSGAKAMLDDGLYDRNLIPKPDVVLAQHVIRMKAGTVGIKPGRLLTATDAFEITIHGRGGHGSSPQSCIDPIVIGASVITRLQSIVSREVTPGELAILSCGCIQAGHVANVIPDTCVIKLSVRSYDPKTREKLKSAIKRIVEAECAASGTERKPDLKHTIEAPATVNDEDITEKITSSFSAYFGDKLVDTEPTTASEDFSLLARAVGAPYVMWLFGGVDPEIWERAVQSDKVDELPGNHSPFFAPVVRLTLGTAVDAMALGALTFLGRK
ncbi:putative zinc metallopeptidase [Aspergillus stella-maris]|uniref:putative zinc metallopeptidase n=1 Tax=Aspergillus stella-maris TaxID=1810926 RepID=UPI003CCDD9AB